ncbi:MAG TPA: hypothetical protein VI197_19350 [Polyangiaceae bacterium]
MAFVLMVVVALIGVVVYLFFVMNAVPGAKAERFGTLEALPDDVGKWSIDDDSEAALAAKQEGLLREVRHFYHEDQQRLALQVRYRDQLTKKIARIEPEVTVPRRRIVS